VADALQAWRPRRGESTRRRHLLAPARWRRNSRCGWRWSCCRRAPRSRRASRSHTCIIKKVDAAHVSKTGAACGCGRAASGGGGRTPRAPRPRRARFGPAGARTVH
jgi:hypothetical protein